jgi:glutaredoxin
MAKKFFDANGVKYEEKDVATDIPARQAMIEKTGQMGVPVIEVDNKIIIGFDKAKLTELLHL